VTTAPAGKVAISIENSSATAGDRLTTVAPLNGELPLIFPGSRGGQVITSVLGG